jgi:hypothetical protein
MSIKQEIELFISGCPVCDEAVDLIRGLACNECEVSVLDMHDVQVAKHAKELGVQSIPAVALDGTLATCCAGQGISEASLRDAGLLCPATA